MTLSFESSRFKKITSTPPTPYFIEGYPLSPTAYTYLYERGRQKLEESDPMTVLAEEAKALARDARSALFLDTEKAATAHEGLMVEGLFDAEEEELSKITAPESLTKTDVLQAPERPRQKAKPRKSLKDSGVSAGDLTVAQIVEAILLCSRSTMTSKKIALAIQDVTEEEVEAAIEELNEFYIENTRSFRIHNIAGGFQIRTDALFEPWLKEVFVKQKTETITPAGNETLAIIAYKQPLTKIEVDNIRGVDCGGHIRSLIEKELVEVCGKSQELGNPNLYGTTKRFLELYGLNSIKDLPNLDDIKNLA